MLTYFNLIISEPEKNKNERLANAERVKQHRFANYTTEFKNIFSNVNYSSGT